MTEEKRTGRWKRGQSGNPGGRPKGVGSVAELRASIGEALPDVIAAIVKKAKDGDIAAARLLIERVIPPLRPIGEENGAPGVLWTRWEPSQIQSYATLEEIQQTLEENAKSSKV